MNLPAAQETNDWTALDLLRLIVIAAMIGASVYLIGSVAAVVTSDSLASPLDLELPLESITNPYPDDATITDAIASVDVEANIGYRLAWWAVTDALAIIGVGFLELLRRLLTRGGDLFTDQNALRLRWMVVLAIAFASVSLLRPVVAIAIQDNAGFDMLEATWDFRSLGFALVLAALLEVWRHGVTMRTDLDLTI